MSPNAGYEARRNAAARMVTRHNAELIALGVGEHYVALLGALTDVDVPSEESK